LQQLKPVRRKSVSEEVFSKLLNQIIQGTWPPKSKLPSENELGKMLNVSRISIRAALDRLNALGVVETRQGEGSFVRGYSIDLYMNSLLQKIVLDQVDLLQVMEYRKIIECGTIPLVIEHATDEDLSKLANIVEEMENSQSDVNLFAIKDFEFHADLARISRNKVIVKVMEILQLILQESVIDIVPFVGTEAGIYYHKQILDALRKRDSELASKLMDEHINTNILRLKDQGIKYTG